MSELDLGILPAQRFPELKKTPSCCLPGPGKWACTLAAVGAGPVAKGRAPTGLGPAP